MSDQHTFRPKHLTLAIALALGCAEFTNAQDLSAHTELPAPADAKEVPRVESKRDLRGVFQAFIENNSTVPKEIDSPENVVKGRDADDLIVVKNGGSFKDRAEGGKGTNVIHLDASDGGELGDTRNFAGLFSSQGSWTLTSKSDFKEGVAVLNDGILTNNGKILGRAIAVGQLINNGEIRGGVDVEEGGTFAGAGTVGSLNVHGQVNVNRLHGAPTVRGNLSLSKTGVLAYEINPDGQGETIKVGGTASLGGSTLKIVTMPGDYPQSSQHTLIEAKKVEGEFGEVLNDLAFMDPKLEYTKKNVGLTYTRNDVPFESLATSDNGREFAKNITEPQPIPEAEVLSETVSSGIADTSAAAETSDPAPLPAVVADASDNTQQPSPIADISGAAPKPSTTANASATDQKPPATTNAAIDALLASNKQTASLALEQLAGSSNANLAKATLSSVDPVSGSMLSAMRQLGNTHGSGNLRDRKNAPRVAAGSEDNGRVWLQALGHSGKLDRDVSPLQHSTKGLLLGADWSIDEEWRLGVMGGKSQTQMDSRELEGNLDSWHLGAYALRQNGPMSLRLGATYSSHDGNTARRVAFTGFSDRPKGSYDASTQQAFAEVGYNLGRANISIEPFASLGYQRYQRDGYTEKGGAAALKVQDQAQNNMNSTVGLRLAKVDILDNGMRLTPRFSAGWKHTYGDVYTHTRQRLVTGGSNYNVYGVELDRNSLPVDAGLDLGVTTNHTVGVGLNGEIGSDSRNHGVMGQWRMAF
ncbi:autotransporter domain-containing protein [Pseudomonas sp. B21-053]|uniref:autotransporter outer membrane beta-barrel domain-containing protein n=1 Tax=Pseudomonas sp. B21-053 TaxID=2895493 RepID=UPI00222F2559|nr:autotransporter outer membrane beta-barrel domain-containing protein [Pseudomonas sp. B21-053]UZE11943.1 autotransporter domain-containing protein [Pseudomonas sp. B21-053]